MERTDKHRSLGGRGADKMAYGTRAGTFISRCLATSRADLINYNHNCSSHTQPRMVCYSIARLFLL